MNFIHKPLYVSIVSLIIALGIGIYEYHVINQPPAYEFVQAGPGTIATMETENGTSTIRHLTLGFLASGRVKDISVSVGDSVTQGMVLASLDSESTLGTLTQAKAAYAAATANYDKVVHGATQTTLNSAQTILTNAQTNLDEVTKQQNLLVANAHRNLLNSTFVAEPDNETTSVNTLQPPVISGTYAKDTEGTIKLDVYPSSGGESFQISGIAEGIGTVSKLVAEPIADTGLYITFPSTEAQNYANSSWTISIPNKLTSNYLANYNAYEAALQTRDQAIATAQAAVKQAQSSSDVVQASARPEDVAAAQAQVDSAYGALQIAQATYNNTVITAPGNGIVTAIYVSPGQTASANVPVIEISGQTSSRNVSLVIPKNAIISRMGKSYVQVKTAGGVTEKEITIGISDAQNSEVTSGLNVGDQVVSH